jgi:hypothetical protein
MTNIQSIKPRTKENIQECVEMYLAMNDEGFLPSDLDFSVKSLNHLVRLNRFVRMAVRDNEILGWIYGDKCQNYHSLNLMFRQQYFCTNQKGATAARVVKFLHDELEQEARNLNIPIVISQGSHLDEANVFTKILEKHGWERRGHTALKHLN